MCWLELHVGVGVGDPRAFQILGGSFGVAERAALRAVGLHVMPRGIEVSPQSSVNQKLVSTSLEQSSELLSEV